MSARSIIDRLNLGGPCTVSYLEGQSLKEIAQNLTSLAPAGESIGYSAVGRWIRTHREAIEKTTKSAKDDIIDKWIVKEFDSYLELAKKNLTEILSVRDQVFKVVTKQVAGVTNLNFSPTVDHLFKFETLIDAKINAALRIGDDGTPTGGSAKRHPFDLDQYRNKAVAGEGEDS